METTPMDFMQQAMDVLEGNPGKKYCYPCWGQAAGMRLPEHLQQLSACAARFVKVQDHRAEHGTCGVCGNDTWIVYKLP